MDNGAGSCILAAPVHADIVAGALRYFDKDRYDLYAWCVMPNHAHAVVRPSGGERDLSSILHSWKSYTGHHLPPVHEGMVWEPESFDHIVRSDEALQGFCQYTLDNQRKAGLRDWRWVGQREELLRG